MFAPLNYLRFDEIWSLANEISRDLCWAYRSVRSESGGIEMSPTPWERDATQCWLLAELLQFTPFFACSPRGCVLRAPPFLLQHADNIQMTSCPIPIEESSLNVEFEGLPLLESAYRFSNRFLWIDVVAGQIKAQPDASLISEMNSGFDEEGKTFLRSRHDVISQGLSHYDGWSICVHEQDIESDERKLLEQFGVSSDLLERINSNSALPMQVCDSSRRGRPRKRDDAERAYAELYPDGHESKGVSFKEAANAVSDFMGVPISDDTLRRALGKKR